MNTLNYIGCKNKLFNTLYSIFKENVPDLENKSFSDLFMGTGIVSYNMLDKCKSVYSNDLESYSFVIGCAILKCSYNSRLKDIIDKCNLLEGKRGLIYKYYSPHRDEDEKGEAYENTRMFFTNSNAMKADAIRQYIQQLLDQGEITSNEFFFLLASLLVSIDKTANTTCVYGAYLKTFKTSAMKDIVLEPIHKNENVRTDVNEMKQMFAEEIAQEQKVDITYLDPPYNQRSYSANYFVLNFIARYDDSIVPVGKTGLFDKNRSDFCSKVRVKDAFEKLINSITSPYIFLSYNNEGLLSLQDMKKILMTKGSVKLYKIKYNKFKAQKKVEEKYVYEYLWVVFSDSFTDSFTEVDLEMI